MKCLSMMEPYATLVANGSKTIETRGWQTYYRGDLAIHASKRFPPEYRALCVQRPFLNCLRGEVFHTGQVIAVVHLDAVLPLSDLLEVSERERCFGDYRPGRFGWVFSHVRRLVTPIPLRGYPSLWDWHVDDDVVEVAMGNPARNVSPLGAE